MALYMDIPSFETDEKLIYQRLSKITLPYLPKLDLNTDSLTIENKAVKISDNRVAKSNLCGLVTDTVIKDKLIYRYSKSVESLEYYSSDLEVAHSFVIILTNQSDVLIVDPTWKQFASNSTNDNLLFFNVSKGSKIKIFTDLLERFQNMPLENSGFVTIWVIPIMGYLGKIGYFTK